MSSGRVQHLSVANNKRDWSINREAVKALVAVYGPNETARQTGIPRGTVMSWCRRYKWKKSGTLIHTSGINGNPGVASKDAADAISEVMAKHREKSTVHLAEYVHRASRVAAKTSKPLDVARKVRDVASVYHTLYPPEQGGELLEGGILIGMDKVTDNPKEMLEKSVEAEVITDVREELSDQRPEGH